MKRTLEQLELNLDNARVFFIRTVTKEDTVNYQKALEVYRKASDDYTKVKYRRNHK